MGYPSTLLKILLAIALYADAVPRLFNSLLLCSAAAPGQAAPAELVGPGSGSPLPGLDWVNLTSTSTSSTAAPTAAEAGRAPKGARQVSCPWQGSRYGNELCLCWVCQLASMHNLPSWDLAITGVAHCCCIAGME